MSCISMHTQTLRARGYRMTPQRLSILQALHAGGHLSPSQLYGRVRQTGMTETTVYRTLEFLTMNGIIFAAHGADGHLAYELAGHDHHHLVCHSCGAEVEVDLEFLEGMTGLLEEKTGYRLENAHLTLFGLCPACQDNSSGEVQK